MNFSRRIKVRVDDKLLSLINKKLQLKKYDGFDVSKFIRISLDDFVAKNFFEYVSNINIVIDVLNDIIIDFNGLNSNITQIINHINIDKGDDTIKLVSNLQKLKVKNVNNINNMKRLIKFLRPFEKQYKKENILMSRITPVMYAEMISKIETYHNINLDISKVIRAAMKYKISKSFNTFTQIQIKLAKELMQYAKNVMNITDEVNSVAFFLNLEKDVSFEEIYGVVISIDKMQDTIKKIVSDLQKASIGII